MNQVKSGGNKWDSQIRQAFTRRYVELETRHPNWLRSALCNSVQDHLVFMGYMSEGQRKTVASITANSQLQQDLKDARVKLNELPAKDTEFRHTPAEDETDKTPEPEAPKPSVEDVLRYLDVPEVRAKIRQIVADGLLKLPEEPSIALGYIPCTGPKQKKVRVLLVGLKGNQETAIRKHVGHRLDLDFLSQDASCSRIEQHARAATYVVALISKMGRHTEIAIKEGIKYRKNFLNKDSFYLTALGTTTEVARLLDNLPGFEQVQGT